MPKLPEPFINPDGITVRELKEIIKDWPEQNPVTGEDCEVWIDAGSGLSNQAKTIMPLNLRHCPDSSLMAADLLIGKD